MDVETMARAGSLGADFPLPGRTPFTLRQAVDAGISRRALERLVDNGVLRRPIRAVYVATEIADSLRLRADCLRLVAPPDAVIVDRHAGWLHGATMVLRPNEHLDLRPVSMFLPAGRGRLRNALSDSGERSFRPDDLMEIEGLRVTSPLRTAWDLGRVRWPDQAIAALDAMLRLDAFTKDELLQGVERFKGMRWVTTLRATATLADGRSESPGESVLRLRCIENGLGGVEPQFELVHQGEFLARLDLAETLLLLAIEYDGEEWHSSPEQKQHDERRRGRIEDETDWLVKVFTKEHVFGRSRECDGMLCQAADEARRRRGIPVLAV